jgi:hypothetical protein
MMILKSKLVAFAFARKHVGVGFGGQGMTIGTLADYFHEFPHLIVEYLKHLHAEGSLYVQNWDSVQHRFRPWTPDVPDTFFNDFYLLAKQPVATR